MVFSINSFQQIHGLIGPACRLERGCLHIVKAKALGVCQVEVRQCKPAIIHEKLIAVLHAKGTANICWSSIRQTGSLEINFCVEPTCLTISVVNGPSGHVEAGHSPVETVHEMFIELEDFISWKPTLGLHQRDVPL